MNTHFENLREILGLLQSNHVQQAHFELMTALEEMPAADPHFNPMFDAAVLIKAGKEGYVAKAKTILEELFVKLNVEEKRK